MFFQTFSVQYTKFSGETLCQIEAVGDNNEDIFFGSMKIKQHIGERIGGAVVEVSGGLVTQNDGWRVDQRARNRNPLALTAGKLRRKMIDPVRQPDFLDQTGCAIARFMAIDGKSERGQQHVFQYRILRQQMVILKHKSDSLVAKFCQFGVCQFKRIFSIN